MMQHSDFARRSLLLFGFSDEAGSRAEDVALSRQRAGIVAAQLRARGLHVDLERGLGPAMPVSDDTTRGGARAQRVVASMTKCPAFFFVRVTPNQPKRHIVDTQGGLIR